MARITAPLLALLLAPLLALPGEAAVAPAARDPAPRWSPPLVRPLEVSGPFRAPEHEYGPGHRGIDMPASPGEAIVAPASGTVSFAGRVADRELVSIRVDARTILSLEPVTSGLVRGDAVDQGSPLGTVSSGGHCAAGCVHLGVRVDGAYVNPLRFYLERPVLLPWE